MTNDFVTHGEQVLTATHLKTGEPLSFPAGAHVVVKRETEEVIPGFTAAVLAEATVNGIPVRPDSLLITEPSHEVYDPADYECDCDKPVEECDCGVIPSRNELYDRIIELKAEVKELRLSLARAGRDPDTGYKRP